MPFIPFTDIYLDGNRLTMTEHERQSTRSTLGSLGTSFLKVWKDSTDYATLQLLQAIQHLCDFTMVLENYVEGRPVSRPPATLTDQRNFTQYALMSLPSAQEIENDMAEPCDVQYEPCRVACIIYSLLVVLPLPPIARLFEKIAAKLQRSLLNIRSGIIEDSRVELQVWILAMGAIISIGLPERDWFVEELSRVLQTSGIRGLKTFTDVLQGFLWHSKTSGRDGIALWRALPMEEEAGGNI